MIIVLEIGVSYPKVITYNKENFFKVKTFIFSLWKTAIFVKALQKIF